MSNLDILTEKYYRKVVKMLIRRDSDYEHLSNAYIYLRKATELNEDNFLDSIRNAFYASKWYNCIKKKDYHIEYYGELFDFDGNPDEEYSEENVNYTKENVIEEINAIHIQAKSKKARQ